MSVSTDVTGFLRLEREERMLGCAAAGTAAGFTAEAGEAAERVGAARRPEAGEAAGAGNTADTGNTGNTTGGAATRAAVTSSGETGLIP